MAPAGAIPSCVNAHPGTESGVTASYDERQSLARECTGDWRRDRQTDMLSLVVFSPREAAITTSIDIKICILTRGTFAIQEFP
jgi:hypothetical protein